MHTTAFVGCGHIHTPGFIKRIHERSDVTVKYVWDHDRDRAARRAGELNAAVAVELSAIWNDAEIGSVIVCSETNLHEELVLAAVEAKKHLFVEKPLGMGAKDAYKMARAIESAGLTFQTGYFMRSSPVNRFLREHIQKGTFGKITRLRHSNCHSGSLGGWFDTEWRWMADPAVAGVGAFGDLGTHSLDIMLWLMGDVEQVTAQIGVATGRYRDCDEYGEALMRFKNGVIGTLAAGWVDVANPVTLVLSGTEGHAHIVDRKLYIKSDKFKDADGQSEWTDLPDELPHAFELFFNVMNGQKGLPLVTPSEAALRSAVMEAMYQGAKEHKWVRPASG